jgi:hypothetical protein
MNFPIIIKEIICAGGACPYQIEAVTSEGKYFYLRYRGGWLKAGVSETESSFNYDIPAYNVIREQIGDQWDGSADHKLFSRKLEGLVVFPKGFNHSYA